MTPENPLEYGPGEGPEITPLTKAIQDALVGQAAASLRSSVVSFCLLRVLVRTGT